MVFRCGSFLNLFFLAWGVIAPSQSLAQEAPLAEKPLAQKSDSPSLGRNSIDEAPPADARQIAFFESEVRPLLVEHCYECHSNTAAKVKAGLYLDSRKGMLKGGDSGPAIVPSNADESLIVQAVRYDGFEMPPKGKLPDKDIQTLATWVAMGAPWPVETDASAGKSREVFDWEKRKASHWAWQPIANPVQPKVIDTSWPANSLDHFILAGLEQAGLQPAPPAHKYTLLRRLALDLIGLPPTLEQMDSYLADSSEQATAQLVDRLLDSPHFGERWGRHWLDLVRFAESRGHEFDNDAPYAYQYRDYIIRALNADVPYDQFIREHIAGDLLKSPRLHPQEQFNESILGTGFWHLGEWVHSPVDIRKDESDRFDNMIDVMSKAFLGLTVSCARCHDHKFDAISTEDYYSLAGFLQSSDYREVAFDAFEHNRSIGSQLFELDNQFQTQASELIAKTVPHASEAINRLRNLGKEAFDDAAHRYPVVADYASSTPSEFYTDGELFGRRPKALGAFDLTAMEGGGKIGFIGFPAAANDPFWNAVKKQEAASPNQMSSIGKLPRSSRTLRSPTFAVRDGNVQCRVRGKGHIVACVDSHRLLAGPLHGETVVTIPAKEGVQWITLQLKRYVGHRLHLEFTPEIDSTLEVQMVFNGATSEQLKAIESANTLVADQAAHCVETMENALQNDAHFKASLESLVANWKAQRHALHQKIRTTSRVAMSMMDGTGEEEHLLIRGSSSNPGKAVPRRFLAAIDGPQSLQIQSGSGRLQLAERINSGSNPLTSRVIVNRIWHHLMGRGIVPTTDDFGALGQPPSHPELLDHLASQFQADGHSIKKTIRRIVLSRAYQMDSRANPRSQELDPKNQWWHHHPQKRLEGETIRDALLSISGRLDPTMYGPSIPVHLSSFMDGRGRPGKSGPLDGSNRRSIYLEVRRNFLSPMFVAFDTPTPFSSMGRRNVSNVPAQALILMNDPLVHELAQAWAKRACDAVPMNDGESTAARVQWLVMTAYSRQASEAELHAAQQFLERHARSNGWSMHDAGLWEDFAHALINKKEFIFQR